MFDLSALQAAIRTHGRVARIVIAAHAGSAPRETGASMLVWTDTNHADGQSGTIGGGALEHQASLAARAQLQTPAQTSRLTRISLGPNLGQCCGGAVTLLTEVYGPEALSLTGPIIVRPSDASAMPLAVKRLLATARGQGSLPATQLLQGWMIEPVLPPIHPLWIWGAGHVGRAIITVMAPLPDLQITWIDVAPNRFPKMIPGGITRLPAADPAAAIALAPKTAQHLILTFSHTLDLELCHRLLIHGFSQCGLIGSATKWKRFQTRLTALGHPAQDIAKITCPIGDPILGKHPQAIAIGVAGEFLRSRQSQSQTRTAQA